MVLGTRVGVLHLAEQREPRLAMCEQVGGRMGVATNPSCIVNFTGTKVVCINSIPRNIVRSTTQQEKHASFPTCKCKETAGDKVMWRLLSGKTRNSRYFWSHTDMTQHDGSNSNTQVIPEFPPTTLDDSSIDWQVKLFEILQVLLEMLTAPAQKGNQSGIQYGSNASE